MRRILRGARVVDPAQDLDAVMDIRIEDSLIESIDDHIDEGTGDTVEDLTGLVLTPGFIDIHIHLREPGFEYKETVASGVRSAARGGFTGVACMANTNPVHDNRSVTELILREAERHPFAHVYPIGSVSRGMLGQELAEIGDMVKAGAVGFSDDGLPVSSSALMRRAMQHARHYGVPIIQHAEDLDLSADGVMNEGAVATLLGLPGIPPLAEDVMVARDLLIAEDTGGKYHVAHLSTGRSLGMVRRAKQAGLAVTCEVTAHHLLLTDTEVARSEFSTATKMKPPLRSGRDREALLAGLQDGTIDAIASDHAPHHCDEKDVQFSAAPFGIVGLETTVSLCLSKLVRPGIISLSRLVHLLSAGPARVLDLPGGSLRPGSTADLTVLDLERENTVDPSRFLSKGASTPFDGWKLRGGVAGTFLGGRRILVSND